MAEPVLKIFKPEVESEPPPVVTRDNHRLLVVDDDPVLLEGLKEILSGSGYDIQTANSAKKALDLVRNDSYSLVLVDQRMPCMTGLELLAEIKVLQPNATRILVTGAPNTETLIEAINSGEIYRFICKPWVNDELQVTVKTGVQRYELVCRNEELHKATLTMNEQLSALNRCLEEKVKMESLQNHQLNELNRALNQNFERCVKICFQTMETFYPSVGKRTRRVQALCQVMSSELHLPEDQARTFEASAWLHEIGLVGLPLDWIEAWQKDPDSIPEEQQVLLRQHTVIGQETAAFVYELSEAANVIRAHHEHFDGTGFPDGRTGEDIPWLARLLSVAIAYVELSETSDDPVQIIRQRSGIEFDPEAVRVLSACLNRIELPRKTRHVPLTKLHPGMRLAQDIIGANHWLLVPEGMELCQSRITYLLHYNRFHRLPDTLAIYD